MIKLMAIDLDGTLYTTDKNITENVKRSISKAMANGIQPVIITGRSRRGAEEALIKLGINSPFVCAAGGLVCAGIVGTEIYAQPFHVHSEMLHLIDFCRRYGAGMLVETLPGKSYWFGSDALLLEMDSLTAKEANRNIRTFEPEIDFDQPILKATLTGSPELLKAAAELIRNDCPSLDFVYSGVQYIDITDAGVNKGSAFLKLIEFLGFERSETAAIGDQEIDIPMLENSGLAIAMTNAVPELKKVARWIAPDNDGDGVAWAIEKILMENSIGMKMSVPYPANCLS